VASRRSNRRTQLSPQREDVEKQEAQWHVSEHAYRDKERAEEDFTPVVHPAFLDGRGREA
jgi:hypothetical protein